MEDKIEQEEQSQVAPSSIPLFIKKLWKMVNDKDAENIISWNETGDSFVIHNQLEFIKNLLPHYFKHNNMASFVRQLNFYSFRKVPNTEDKIEFTHPCFMKDVPEILPFIRRKNPVLKQKAAVNQNEQEVEELLSDVKNLKGKHTLVDKELAMIKQENAALWNELNSLRLKYTKQSTIINMLIHFLITYIHSHQTSFSKPNIQVSSDETNRNNIKVGPTLLEIGYKNNKKQFNKSNTEPYTVIEPSTSSSITYSVKLPENNSESQRPRKNIHSLDEIMEDQTYSSMKRPKKKPLTYSIKLPGTQSENLSRPEIQRSLLEILKENERLCEEDTDETFQELDAEIENLNDPIDQQTTEDITVETPEETPEYIISYPTENNDATIESIDHPEYVDVTDLISQKLDNVETNAKILTNQNLDMNPVIINSQNNTITKEIPISTKSGIMKYKITQPNLNILQSDLAGKKLKIINPSIIKNPIMKPITNNFNKKPKFIKIPAKNLKQVISDKNIKPIATKTNVIKISPNQSPKQTSMKHNFAQNIQSSQTANPEGALWEILKENEKLQEPTSIDNLLNNPTIDENLDNLFDDGIEVPITNITTEENVNLEPQPVLTRSKSVTKEKPNIMDNPKENLSMYVDDTQEEIDMLQDILNDLTSKDLSEILNTNHPPTDINLDIEDIGQEGVATDEPMEEEYINLNESVDKYFKNNFLENK